VLESFRQAHPDHELYREATKQLAFVYQQLGDLARAAGEYERVAREAEEPALRSEALLIAGDLYERSQARDRALAAYLEYVGQFPEPIATAVETRSKIAGMYEATGQVAGHREQLRQIVAIDAAAGGERTPRIRDLAARAALVLSEDRYREFGEVALRQPFEPNLKEKQRRLDVALEAFDALVDYEVGEVTAAATFYGRAVPRLQSRAERVGAPSGPRPAGSGPTRRPSRRRRSRSKRRPSRSTRRTSS
jgi:tetratricopeptide (TPR) repeat protein